MSYIEIKETIFAKIKQYESIIIVRHIKPDGDCMGSSLGLRDMLRASFPDKKIYSIGNTKSDFLGFLGEEDQELKEENYRNSLVIAVDTATKDRIDNKFFEIGKELIKIDHHIDVDAYGDINYVREDLPATCAIICDFYVTFKDNLILNEQASSALFVGMVTDTGRFKYRGVSGEVLRLTAELLDRNINLEYLYANLYIKSLSEYKLQGYILNKFKTTPAGVSFFFMTKRIQNRFKVSVEDASALVNVLDSIRGNLIWIFFIEQPDKSIRVRMRSRFVGINDIAARYRGGGHKQAAGATVYNKKEIKQLLEETDRLLEEYKREHKGVF